jgi:hypothetical protein
MRKSWRALMSAAALLVALPLAAQQTAKEAQREAGSADQYDKLLRRSGHHDILARLEGNWQGTNMKVLVWGTPFRETVMTDTLNVKLIFNGNFLEAEEVSNIEGQVGRSKIIMGYNGADKEFYRLYMNEGEPRGTWSTGVHLRARDALIFNGTEHDPVSGDKFTKREIFDFGPDKDEFGYELIYVFADGSEMKVVEGVYKRVKEAPKP